MSKELSNELHQELNSESKTEQPKAGRVAESITTILSAFCIVLFLILLIALPKKDFSNNENRYLASMPELTWKHIQEGSYMKDLDTYVTDHFPYRDFWMGLQSESQKLMGKCEINGVILADDGYLIENYSEPKSTERIAASFEKLAQKCEEGGYDAKLMLVPTAITIYEDRLPQAAVTFHQLATINEIRNNVNLDFIDVYDTLYSHRDDGQLFYRTDHHWTTLGAYYAYVEYCKEVGITPQPLDAMDEMVATEEFQGTYFSKVNLWSAAKDEIILYSNPSDQLIVDYTDKNSQTDSLYNLDYVQEKDKYSLFLDNLHTLIEITNENADSGKQLLLVKDSYANSMVPFLVHHYDKIYVVDTRYFKDGPSSLLKEHPEITDVLILYNMSTIDTDTGVRGIF